jgi:hypothetical protein
MQGNKIGFYNQPNLSHISSNTRKYLPEPATKGIGIFKDIINIAGGLAKTVSSASGIGIGGVSDDFLSLLELQINAQKEMQSVSMMSNIEKSKHETRMTPIRNLRVA